MKLSLKLTGKVQASTFLLKFNTASPSGNRSLVGKNSVKTRSGPFGELFPYSEAILFSIILRHKNSYGDLLSSAVCFHCNL